MYTSQGRLCDFNLVILDKMTIPLYNCLVNYNYIEGMIFFERTFVDP